jgi:TetR/AcrR family transcriptional repressor of nem operon
MPRTQEFEPEAALHHAMELFWCNGYEATSMRDLLEGMGIGRGSFYDTYGDKRSLFLAALDRFERTRTAWVPEALEEGELPVRPSGTSSREQWTALSASRRGAAVFSPTRPSNSRRTTRKSR